MNCTRSYPPGFDHDRPIRQASWPERMRAYACATWCGALHRKDPLNMQQTLSLNAVGDQLVPNGTKRLHRTVLAFVALLIAIDLSIVFLFPGALKDALVRLTGRLAEVLAQPFGTAVFSKANLVIDGFSMQIAAECTALHFLAIFVAAVIAYPGRGYRSKAFGVLAGVAVLFALNAVRIMILGFVGAHVPGIFDITHLYLWKVLFALAVVAAWAVWVQRSVIDRPLPKKIAMALVASVAGFLVLALYMQTYLEALTAAALPIASLLFDRAPQAMIVTGDVVRIDFGSYAATTRTIAINAYSQLIFVALLATLLGSVRLFRLLGQALFGLCMIFILFLGHVLFLVWEVNHAVSASVMDVLDVTVRTFSLAVCIGLYLYFKRGLDRRTTDNTVDTKGGTSNETIVALR